MEYSGTSDFLNNSLLSTEKGYAYYVLNSTSIGLSDHNNLHSTTSKYAYWGANKYTLASLQGISGKDLNSIDVSPLYYSYSDLHTHQQPYKFL